MLKNLSKELSIYLLIMAAAAAGFALIALSKSTTALATSHDEVILTADNCWKHVELGEPFTDEGGASLTCDIGLKAFPSYLDYKLPPIDETYDTRENYIQRLQDDIVAACLERRAGSSLARCNADSDAYVVYAGYLFNHLSITTSGDLNNGQESELLVMLWADIKVNEWGNQERYEQDDLPPTAGSYYVYRPTVEPQPPQTDREPPQRSPDTPPASLPPESSFEDTHEDNQQGWDDSQDDQYRYDDDGYYRRKKQGDGTFKCYFNGYDGSLANLGEC